VSVFFLHVELDILALVNKYSGFVLVKLGVRSYMQRNVLDIQQMNLILLDGQRKPQTSLCLSRDSNFRPSEYNSDHL
jgi:hypothetical protein